MCFEWEHNVYSVLFQDDLASLETIVISVDFNLYVHRDFKLFGGELGHKSRVKNLDSAWHDTHIISNWKAETGESLNSRPTRAT